VRSLAPVSAAYDALVARCLDPDPVRRPAMAHVARVLRGEPIADLPDEHDERVTQDIGAIPPAPIPASITASVPAPAAPTHRRGVLIAAALGASAAIIATAIALTRPADAPPAAATDPNPAAAVDPKPAAPAPAAATPDPLSAATPDPQPAAAADRRPEAAAQPAAADWRPEAAPQPAAADRRPEAAPQPAAPVDATPTAPAPVAAKPTRTSPSPAKPRPKATTRPPRRETLD